VGIKIKGSNRFDAAMAGARSLGPWEIDHFVEGTNIKRPTLSKQRD
jgi:hypothetical protein